MALDELSSFSRLHYFVKEKMIKRYHKNMVKKIFFLVISKIVFGSWGVLLFYFLFCFLFVFVVTLKNLFLSIKKKYIKEKLFCCSSIYEITIFFCKSIRKVCFKQTAKKNFAYFWAAIKHNNRTKQATRFFLNIINTNIY